MDARIVGAGVALYGVQTKKEWTKDVAGPFLFEPVNKFFDGIEQELDQMKKEKLFSAMLFQIAITKFRNVITEEEKRIMKGSDNLQ
jgi:hypothetical protein